MVQQQTPGTGTIAVEPDRPATTPDQAPTDPRAIGDDGRILGDDDLIWATPATGITPIAAPTSATPTPTSITTDAPVGRRQYTWGQVLIVLAGATALVFGIGAVGLGGLAGPVTAPVVDVFSFDHTPLLGLIEIAVGAVLVLTGLVRGGRWIAGPVGVATVVGGALVIAELEWVQTELAAQQRFGWVPVIVGTVAYLGAMVPAKPSRARAAAMPDA
jgi:hypothetical protein